LSSIGEPHPTVRLSGSDYYSPDVSSVAYPAQHRAPSAWRTAWDLLVGWILGAACLAVIYVAGWFLGVIGLNTASEGGVINQWPFPDNGWWSLAANFSVLVLALLVATLTTAWKLRESFQMLSEARLAIVLLFTGGVPLVTPTGHGSAFAFLFLVAVWLVRKWVVRAGHRFSRRGLGISALGLMLTIVAYGAVHPVWVESAMVAPSLRGTKSQRTLTLTLRNASWAPVTVEQLSGGFLFPRVERASGTPQSRFPSRTSKTFALLGRASGCATLITDARIRYRLLGLSFSSPLQIEPSGFECPRSSGLGDG
jgi:hypothetical protein